MPRRDPPERRSWGPICQQVVGPARHMRGEVRCGKPLPCPDHPPTQEDR